MKKTKYLYILLLIFFSLSCSLTSNITDTVIGNETTTPQNTTTNNDSGEDFIQEQTEDDYIIFTDSKYNYQIKVHEDWLIVDPSAEEMGEIISKSIELFPEFGNIVPSAEDMAKQGIRVILYNINEKYIGVGFIPNINFLVFDTIQFNQVSYTDLIEENKLQYPQIFPNFEFQSSAVQYNPGGVEYGEINYSFVMGNSDTETKVFQKQVFVKINKGMIIITFSANNNNDNDLKNAFQEIIDSMDID